MSYEGHLVQCSECTNPGTVYVVLPWGAAPIPNPATAVRLFGDNWAQRIIQITPDQLEAIGMAPSLGPYSVLAKGNPLEGMQDKVYLVWQYKKSWITSPEVMDKYDFEDGTTFVKQVVLANIPDGPDIT